VKKNEAVKGLNRYFVSENKERVNLKIWGFFGFGKACGRRWKLETTRVILKCFVKSFLEKI
jgi:hypothetical protein